MSARRRPPPPQEPLCALTAVSCAQSREAPGGMGGNPIERSSSQGCSGPSISTVDARPLIIQRGLLGDKLRPGDEDADYARQTIAMIESAIGSDFGGVFISTLTIQ